MPSRRRLTVAQKKARAEKAAATRARNKAIRAQQNSDGDQPQGGEERNNDDDDKDLDDHNNGHNSGSQVREACYRFLSELDPMLRDANKRCWRTLEVTRTLAIDRKSPHPQHSKELGDRYEEFLKVEMQYAQQLDDRRSKVREMALAISKPHLRPLRILDMPNEILMEIFEYLAHDEWLNLESRIVHEDLRPKDIRNIRLTCRQFYSTSSHLLIRFVRLDCFNPSSLSRFEEIARHSMLSKGVETIRIYLGFYAPSLAADISLFAAHMYERLCAEIDNGERLLSCSGSSARDPGKASSKQQLENLEKAKKIAGAWDVFAAAELDPEDAYYEEDMSYRKLLERGHREYQLCFAAQEKLKQDGNFVRAVATAMSKMPNAKRLQFRANRILPAGYSFYGEKDDNAMYDQLVQYMQCPLSWRDAEEQQLWTAPTEMLVQLPGAIHKAGASLTDISIILERPTDFSNLAQSQDDLHDLTAAVKNLKRFKLHLGSEDGRAIWWAAEQPESEEALRKFLQAVLDAPRLERLNLKFQGLWDVDDPTPPSFSLGSFTNLKPWQELKEITWRGLPIHLAEMSRFLDQHAGKSISTSETYLLSGTWAEALDLFRDKAPLASIEMPFGAECDTLSMEEMLEIFGYSTYRHGECVPLSNAQKYLQGQISCNPLREPPAAEANAGEPSNEEAGDEEAGDDEADGNEAGDNEADGEGPADEEMIDAA